MNSTSAAPRSYRIHLPAAILLAIVLCIGIVPVKAQNWSADLLGDGYESRTVNQGNDYSGKVVSTIIRKLAPDSIANGDAILYVHGFNDYFFQAQEGDEFVSHGYDFYAVDLRKYGRSMLPGQRIFNCRSITEYYPDIDSALATIGDARKVVLMGHSTGGLICASFMATQSSPQIKALILNSPFLDWNLGWMEHMVPLVAWWGKFFPNTEISQGNSTAYSDSLLKSKHGEWQFNTNWKHPQSPDVTAGWVRAIDEAQKALRDGKAHIAVPILLMYSAHKAGEGREAGDAVLDPADIKRYGLMLGPNVICIKVVGGLHDLMLSAPAVRQALYARIFPWLAKNI